MDRKTLPWLLVLGIFSLGLVLSLGVPSPVFAFSTTTTTVVGWLFPDGTHWNSGIGALLFPLVGVGLFAGIAKLVDAEGGVGVTLILAGLTMGAVVGMLSVNNATTGVVLPFALVVVPGADLLIWMWKGEG